MKPVKSVPVILIFSFAVILLFVLSFLLLQRIKNQAATAESMNHTNLVRYRLEETISQLKEAESDQRGFLLTKDSSFYYSRPQAYQKINTNLRLLHQLFAENPLQQRRVDTLTLLAGKRIERLENLLRLYNWVENTNPEFRNSLKQGHMVMETVQLYVQKMLNEEARLLREREKGIRKNQWLAPAYAWILMIITLLVLIYAAYEMNRQLHQAKTYFLHSQKANKKLKETNTLFENAEQSAGIGSWRWNITTQEFRASKNLLKLYGLDAQEPNPTLRTFFPYVHPEDKESVSPVLTDEAFTTKKSLTLNYRIIAKDGTLKYVQGIRKYFRNEKGEKIVLGTTQDVTELTLATNKLKESEAFNRNITELAPNGIYIFDLDARKITYVNKGLLEFYGYSADELAQLESQSLATLVHPDDLEKVEQHFQWFANAGDGDVLEYEYRIRNKEGVYRHLFIREAVFKRAKNGRVEQVIGVAMDLTELKGAEQKLQLLNRELEERNTELKHSNENLASFNYIASHDLQEPLRKIEIFSKLIEEREKGLTAGGMDFLERVKTAAGRMRNLIRDLLAYSRVNMVEEKWDHVNLNDILDQVRSAHKMVLDDKEAIIQSDWLPVVWGIAFQLQTLFENIITNAIKYSKPGTPLFLHIRSELLPHGVLLEGLKPEKQYHRICFRDNGIGFEQEFAHKIFEPFQRLHAHHNFQGTGIGLAICKKIIENHGGAILASGNPGEGATFEIYLPAD